MTLDTDARLSVCVIDNLDSCFLKPLGQLSNKELGPTVVGRRDRDEGRRYEGDFQCRRLIIKTNETLMPGTGHPLLLQQLGFGGLLLRVLFGICVQHVISLTHLWTL